MVLLAVSAILVAVAAPSFRTFIQNSRISSTTDGFVAGIQQARSEAITRGNKVILCRTADPTDDTCGDSDAKDWSRGWLMYAVPTAASEVSYTSSADNVLIRRGEPAPQGVTITSDADGNTYLTFGSDGTLNEPNVSATDPVHYAVCDDRGEAAGRLIVIPMIGRPHVTSDFSDAPGCVPNN
jgi:type IV fimbrial biogenesis protein FimT